MRTTITIDNDVLEKAREIAVRRNIHFKSVINEALRYGLKEVEKPALQRPYTTKPHPMGLLPGRNLNNIQELLSQADGEDSR